MQFREPAPQSLDGLDYLNEASTFDFQTRRVVEAAAEMLGDLNDEMSVDEARSRTTPRRIPYAKEIGALCAELAKMLKANAEEVERIERERRSAPLPPGPMNMASAGRRP